MPLTSLLQPALHYELIDCGLVDYMGKAVGVEITITPLYCHVTQVDFSFHSGEANVAEPTRRKVGTQ